MALLRSARGLRDNHQKPAGTISYIEGAGNSILKLRNTPSSAHVHQASTPAARDDFLRSAAVLHHDMCAASFALVGDGGDTHFLPSLRDEWFRAEADRHGALRNYARSFAFICVGAAAVSAGTMGADVEVGFRESGTHCAGASEKRHYIERPSGACLETREIWERGFFDHLVRNAESYAQKWEYVRQNPVRAGLVERAEEWPYQGEIVEIRHS